MGEDQLFKVFGTCYETDTTILATDPYTTDRDNMVSMAQQLLRSDGDFFGVIDENNVTLQFMMDGAGGVWMEIPIPSKNGSYGKRIQIQDLEGTLLLVGACIEPEEIGGMEFQQW